MALTPTEFRVRPVDAVALTDRARELGTRSIQGDAVDRGLALAVRMTDLTTLEGADTPGRVRSLCAKALHPGRGSGPVAAVCVYPDLVAVARQMVGAAIHVASVATGFPAGRTDLAVKLAETRSAVAAGADEIDMVIDRGAFLAGHHRQVFDEIRRVKDACGAARLKVILETHELCTYDNVRKAARIALLAGADFLKTSTGKVAVNATPPVVLLMLQEVRDHFLETGRAVGVKAAGGIRTAADALRYLVLVNETCGDRWMTPDGFRFGASSLLNDLIMQRARRATGTHQRPGDFSVD